MANQIKLNEVIRELLLETQDPDSYLHGTTETLVMFHVRNAFTHLMAAGEIRGNVLSLSIELIAGWRLPLPEDFMKFIALYGVNGQDGKLHPLFLDNRIIISGGYLLDSDGEILFDNNGVPLMDRTQTYPAPNAGEVNYPLESYDVNSSYQSGFYGRRYNLKSGVETANGQYRLDLKNRLFTITESPYTTFVLDYVADPSYYTNNKIGDVLIFKSWKDAVKALAYFELISRRRSVPMNEKLLAEKQKNILIKKAKLTNAPSIKEYVQWLNRSNGGAVQI